MLGRGAAGVVYKAKQSGMDRVVAVKLLAADGVHDVPRFQRECQTLSRLDHPGIVRPFAWGGMKDGTRYLVMEYVPGRTLDQVLREGGPLPADKVLAMAVELCDALSYAHDLGVVHRDLKPHNIMVSDDGSVKLLDFGLAKFVGADLRITRTEAIVGTPLYMAPEQFMSKEAGPRTDMYSLACTLYEMLTGKPAFDGDSPFAIFTAHTSGEFVPLPDSVPEAMRNAIEKTLQADPERRFASVDEFRNVLIGKVTVPSAPRVVPDKKPNAAPAVKLPLGKILAAVLVLGSVVAAMQCFLVSNTPEKQAEAAEKDHNYAKALLLYQKVYKDAEESKGMDSPQSMGALTAIGRCQRALGQTNELMRTWKERLGFIYEKRIERAGGKSDKPTNQAITDTLRIRAEELGTAQQFLPADSIAVADLLTEQARDALLIRSASMAAENAESALKIYDRQPNQPFLSEERVQALYALSRAYWAMDRRKEAEEICLRGIDEAVRLRRRMVSTPIELVDSELNFFGTLIQLRATLATYYFEEKRYKEAFDLADLALSQEFSFALDQFPKERRTLRKLRSLSAKELGIKEPSAD